VVHFVDVEDDEGGVLVLLLPAVLLVPVLLPVPLTVPAPVPPVEEPPAGAVVVPVKDEEPVVVVVLVVVVLEEVPLVEVFDVDAVDELAELDDPAGGVGGTGGVEPPVVTHFPLMPSQNVCPPLGLVIGGGGEGIVGCGAGEDPATGHCAPLVCQED
jgi:hypothetical protein